MTTRFPASNLPPNMTHYQRTLENTLVIAENAQDNSERVLASMRESVSSNYGLGSRLPTEAGSLSSKVITDLQNAVVDLTSSATLQRAWTNLDGTLTVTSPAFTSDVMLAIAGTASLVVTGGVVGASYAHWLRISLTGGMTQNKVLPKTNFGQVIFTESNVPANTDITVRMQAWGIIKNPDNSFVNGTITTTSDIRISTSMRAIALV